MKWLTSAQAGARINRSPKSIRAAAEAGELHGHQPMRNGHPIPKSRWSFSVDAVDAFVQNLDDRAQRNACGCAALHAVRRAS